MKYQHKKLASGNWQKLSLVEQMANIGSEVERAISWQEKNNKDYSKLAFFRALELLELSISDPKNKTRLKELTRVYEALGDFFFGPNQFKSSKKIWRQYFFGFALAVRNQIS